MNRFAGVFLFLVPFVVLFFAGFHMLRWPIAIHSKQITGYLAPTLMFASIAYLGGGGFNRATRGINRFYRVLFCGGGFLIIFFSGMMMMYEIINILSREVSGYMIPSLVFSSLAYLGGWGMLDMVDGATQDAPPRSVRSRSSPQ